MTVSARLSAFRSGRSFLAIAGIGWGLCGFSATADAAQASYRCEKGVTFDIDVAANGKRAILFLPGGLEVPVARAASGSGFRFNGGGFDLHGKDPSALLTRPEGDTLTCRRLPKKLKPPPQEVREAEPEQTGASFDCSGDLSATQQRICANSLLAELDGRMAEIYAGLRKKLRGSTKRRLQTEQTSWLEERDKCGKDDSCIEDHYYGRNAYLEEYELPGTAPPPVVVATTEPPPPAAPAEPVAPAVEPAPPVATPSPAAPQAPAVPEPLIAAAPPAQTAPAPEPPPAAAVALLPRPGQSGGGLVRVGPGKRYRRIDTLRDGDPIILLEDTGIELNGYNWFRIQYGSRRGFQWGGLICAKGQKVPGALKACQ